VGAARGRARSVQEPLRECRVVVEQERDRDLAAELRVAREEHLAHAAARDLANQAEAIDLRVLAELERLPRLAPRSRREATAGLDALKRLIGRQQRGRLARLLRASRPRGELVAIRLHGDLTVDARALVGLAIGPHRDLTVDAF